MSKESKKVQLQKITKLINRPSSKPSHKAATAARSAVKAQRSTPLNPTKPITAPRPNKAH
jgi:hypothetical protein